MFYTGSLPYGSHSHPYMKRIPNSSTEPFQPGSTVKKRHDTSMFIMHTFEGVNIFFRLQPCKCSSLFPRYRALQNPVSCFGPRPGEPDICAAATFQSAAQRQGRCSHPLPGPGASSRLLARELPRRVPS